MTVVSNCFFRSDNKLVITKRRSLQVKQYILSFTALQFLQHLTRNFQQTGNHWRGYCNLNMFYLNTSNWVVLDQCQHCFPSLKSETLAASFPHIFFKYESLRFFLYSPPIVCPRAFSTAALMSVPSSPLWNPLPDKYPGRRNLLPWTGVLCKRKNFNDFPCS